MSEILEAVERLYGSGAALAVADLLKEHETDILSQDVKVQIDAGMVAVESCKPTIAIKRFLDWLFK